MPVNGRKLGVEYKDRLTNRDVVRLLRKRLYYVDFTTGNVLNMHGRVITPFAKDGHLYVRLYHGGNWKRIIGVAQLVWMAKTMHPIPRGFEVHHRNQVPTDNRWENLFLLHRLDHQKLHGGDLLQQDDIPF